MTQQPFSSAALRGAVDLSGLGRTQQGQPSPSSSGQPGGDAETRPAGGVPGRSGALIHVEDSTFEAVLTASATAPVVLVLWTPQVPESLQHLKELGKAARAREGRFQVAAVDLGANPAIMQALTPLLQQAFGQVSALPVVLGWISGQPVPMYLGVQPMEQVDQVLDKFLEAAVANGIAGRVDVSQDVAVDEETPAETVEESGAQEEAPELPPLHQAAYDAIDAGDWATAISSYEEALQQDPSDELARLGLGQVTLLQRTSEMDLNAVRQRAADHPADVQAQIDAADVDLVGGHVEDGFLRLVDTVRRTAGEDREKARTHLLELFEVIGHQDERVVRARRSLMSALF